MTLQIQVENINAITQSFEKLSTPDFKSCVAYFDTKKISTVEGVSGVWLSLKLQNDLKIIRQETPTNIPQNSIFVIAVSVSNYFKWRIETGDEVSSTNIGLLLNNKNDFEFVLHKDDQYYMAFFVISEGFLTTYTQLSPERPRSFGLSNETIVHIALQQDNEPLADSFRELIALNELFFSSILSLIGDNQTTSDIDVTKINQVKEHIHLHLKHHQPKLGDLVNIAGMSKSSLKTKFKKHVGVSIQEYFMREKMKLANAIILNGTSIKEVAIELGYNSTSGFSNAFKKVVGVPPSQIIHKK